MIRNSASVKAVQFDSAWDETLGAAVHIHIISPRQVDRVKYAFVLDEQEYSRGRAFKFEKDRDLFEAAHIFLRKILSLYAKPGPEKWAFASNKFGKPAISNEGYGHLRFNLSHTKGLVACAVCYEREVGVDVEYIKQMADLPGLARYVLTEDEQAYLFGITDKEEQSRAFLSYWTLKEAYVKARSEGLSIPLKEIQFMQSKPGSWTYAIQSAEAAPGNMWMLKHGLNCKHLLALSVRKTQGEEPPPVNLTNWDISPEPEALAFNVPSR